MIAQKRPSDTMSQNKEPSTFEKILKNKIAYLKAAKSSLKKVDEKIARIGKSGLGYGS